MGIQLEETENAGGLSEMREELDRNPDGDRSPLQKALKSGSERSGVKWGAFFFRVLKAMKRSPKEHPQYRSPKNRAPMGMGVSGHPLGDYVVVLQDRYRDELQCRKCAGRGYGTVECRGCGGTGLVQGLVSGEFRPVECADCRSSDFDSPALPKSTGKLPCSECRGTGQASARVTGLVTSTENAKEPSTGVIVAVGKTVTEFMLGERILYSQFTGITYECEGRLWRVIKQSYPIMILEGDGDVKMREG